MSLSGAPPRTAGRGPAKPTWRRSPLAGNSFLLLWMSRGRGCGARPEAVRCCGQCWEPARGGNHRESFLSRVPAGPSGVSLPGVPQNFLSGQRLPPPLSQISPSPPGCRGPGMSPYALVSLPFLCTFKSRPTVIKKGGASSSLLTRWRRGDADPTEGAGCRTPVTSAQGFAPSPRPRKAALAMPGRPTRVGPGTGTSFVQPAQQSLSTGRTRMSPS